MAELKKVLISFPDNLLREIDTEASIKKVNRSEFVREVMRRYLQEKKKMGLREKMKKGYQEMAEINLKLAEFCHMADNEIQRKYEDSLMECERSGY